MAEKRVIQLEVQDNVQSVKKQFAEAKKELQQMAAAYGENSVQAIEAAKRAAQLKDIIDDSGEAIKNLQGGGAFQALGSSLTSTASGFSAVQGALGLVGVEGEKVQEALLKVQSAMALAEGLKGLEDAGRAFGALKAIALDTFKGIKGALLATGIGVFIAALGVLVANWEKVSEAIGLTNKRQEALNSTLEDYRKGAQDAIQKTQKVKSAFDLAKSGVISKEEALQTYNDTLGDSLGKAKSLDEAESLYAAKADAYVKAQAKKAQANALFNKSAELMAQSLTAAEENNTTFLDNVSAGFKISMGDFKSGTEEIVKQNQKRTKERQKQLDAQAKMLEEEAGKLLKESETIEKQNNINVKSDEAAAEKRKQAAEKAADARRDALEKIKAAEQEYLDSKLSAEELEIKKTEEKYDELIRLAKKYNQDTAILERARGEQLFKIRSEAKAKELEAENKALEERRAKEAEEDAKRKKEREDFLAQEAEYNEMYIQQQQQIAEQEKAQEEARKQREENRIAATQNVLNTILSLNELFQGKSKKDAERAFKVQKAVNIASALIDTYKSATAAYASQFTPLPDPSSPIRGAIAAAAAVAAGLANVKQIASQKFDGGGSVSAGGGGAGSTGAASITPSFNVVGQGSENPLQQFDAKQPLKAYVVSKEVTDQQNLDSQIQKNAQFG